MGNLREPPEGLGSGLYGHVDAVILEEETREPAGGHGPQYRHFRKCSRQDGRDRSRSSPAIDGTAG